MKAINRILRILLAILVMGANTQTQAVGRTVIAEEIDNRGAHKADSTFSASSLDPLIILETQNDSIRQRREYAHTLLEEVLRAQRFLENLDAFAEAELPVGVVRRSNEVDYTILIDRIEFSKEGALMDVYVSLALPQTGSRLAFHGKVPLSAEGGVAGNARVYLIGDHQTKIGNHSLLTIRGDQQTFVEFDCSGFIGINLSATLEFSTDLLVPETRSGKISNERLKISIETYLQSLHDILVEVTIPPFQIRDLKGFGFYVNKATLDWSDLANPEAIVFPRSYPSPFVKSGLRELWQGIYLRELEVRLPPSFKTSASSGRIAVGIKEVILDDLGLTGDIFIENVIRSGDMRGWRYTVDRLALEMITNNIKGFSLEGKIYIPVLKEKDGTTAAFAYKAYRNTQGNYSFAVRVKDEVKLGLWAADLRINPGSSVVVREKEDDFFPEAVLNGVLTINLADKGPKVRFNSIRFEKMIISSEPPFFTPGVFAFGHQGDQPLLSKFPVVFDNITVENKPEHAGLAFDMLVNIGGDGGGDSFAGRGRIIIWGKQAVDSLRDEHGELIGVDKNSWKFERVELSSVKIKVSKPGIIDLAGEIDFFNEDAIYGDGFKGKAKGRIQKITVEAEVLFGRTETFRYWYADALVELKTGVPIVPGALSAFGFGGGFYQRMKQSDVRVATAIGNSPSGITYVPDESTIGIRAIVLIGTPRPEAMRGDVALEVSINRNGGINSVTFTGNASFMSTESPGKNKIKELAAAATKGALTEKLGSLGKGQVYGSVRLHFDNVNDVFHGNLEVFVNVAGGIVRGVGEGSRAGWAVMHFESRTWYIHIGTPDQPLGLEVARIFKSKSYFMLGQDLPGSPSPPPQVSEILGNIDLDYMRDMNALQSGFGIAFGLHFIVDTGDLQFLMFYGRFSAGTGLDFMLKDYGNEYHCAGDSGPIGINGWYANGQAYAFVMGKVGIKVNLKFYKGTFDILSIGAAAILQAKGPNPFWMKGTVGGYYKILGGLVKGQCRFEVTIGKDCKPVLEEKLLDDISIIAAVSPANGVSDVSVFNTPQVVFNFPINEVFEIRDLSGKKHLFRGVLDEFSITERTRRIDGTIRWNDHNDVAIFDGQELLPGKSRIKIRIKVSFEEHLNGIWKKVLEDGKPVAESVESMFQTAEAPQNIPYNNIASSYPTIDQQYFLPGEFPHGHISLKEGQAYLFDPGREKIQFVRFTNIITGHTIASDLEYDRGKQEINFRIPEGLAPEEKYTLEILTAPRQQQAIDHNVTTSTKNVLEDGTGATAIVSTKQITAQLERNDAVPLATINFNTSRYSTFRDKILNTRIADAFRIDEGINVFSLRAPLENEEGFELAEAKQAQPGITITAEALLPGNPWYDKHVFPLMYDQYPILGWMKLRRAESSDPGIPPSRAIRLQSLGNVSHQFLEYNVGKVVASDFRDLQKQAVNYAVDHPQSINPRIEALINQPMPWLRYGAYPVRLEYVIPNGRVSSRHEVVLFNPIYDNQ